ncbi:MAG TPA: dihydrolipoamide acetyltransferase family protein [Actinomycetota bacterium]|nr:dihydrolipoamide acetyltransferase family protein [Actinomycetota bacterium]
MATAVRMPQMGESVVEGTILKWLKSEGDKVDADDALVEVSTDKVDTEIPSPVAGVLTKILVEEGASVEVGTTICEVDEGGEAAGGAEAGTTTSEEAGSESSEGGSEAAQASPGGTDREVAASGDGQKAAAPSGVPAAQSTGAGSDPVEQSESTDTDPSGEPHPESPGSNPPRAPAVSSPSRGGPPTRSGEGRPGGQLSPLVRRLAREHDVDLSQVRGSGPGGRITKQDVIDHADGRGSAPAAPPAAPQAPAAQPGRPGQQSPPAVRQAAGERDEVQPLTHIRKRIAEHMVKSLQTSARAWNAVEVDMENIARLRAQVNPEFKKREGMSLTYLPFIVRACVDALAHVPMVNASVSADLTEATLHHYVNVGVAVATDYGLIVPVVKGAETMTVVGISRAIADIANKARNKSLAPDDVGGSTFTITNPGPFGSYLSVPVINQPNVAILSTEAVEQRVAVVDGMIAIRHRTFLSMSWDHRLLDGSDAMRFLARLKENLETWDFAREVVQP